MGARHEGGGFHFVEGGGFHCASAENVPQGPAMVVSKSGGALVHRRVHRRISVSPLVRIVEIALFHLCTNLVQHAQSALLVKRPKN